MATKRQIFIHSIHASLFYSICEKRSNIIYKEYSEPTEMPQMYQFLNILLNALPHIPGCLWKQLDTLVSAVCSSQQYSTPASALHEAPGQILRKQFIIVLPPFIYHLVSGIPSCLPRSSHSCTVSRVDMTLVRVKVVSVGWEKPGNFRLCA